MSIGQQQIKHYGDYCCFHYHDFLAGSIMMDRSLLEQHTHFAFGKNWLEYGEKIDEARIEQACADLRRLAGRDRMDGRGFLDIGCGSGLHSLAAVRMGATLVRGIDIDPDSVEASRRTLQRFEPNADAQFSAVSVFDTSPQDPGTFDVVYSWGVLHHTGDMNRALAKAAELVKPRGQLLIALYHKTPFCGMWRMFKRRYSKSRPEAQRRTMDRYIWLMKQRHALLGQDFTEYVSNYQTLRGMDFHNDVHDWLGGYPYESIEPEACVRFFNTLGFQLERSFVAKPKRMLSGILGTGCDEFAFRKVDEKR
jgi:2-polyprenyl-3-methyl-5-hydroxy-6-metoxy-1,4-benzoquinol methylase